MKGRSAPCSVLDLKSRTPSKKEEGGFPLGFPFKPTQKVAAPKKRHSHLSWAVAPNQNCSPIQIIWQNHQVSQCEVTGIGLMDMDLDTIPQEVLADHLLRLVRREGPTPFHHTPI